MEDDLTYAIDRLSECRASGPLLVELTEITAILERTKARLNRIVHERNAPKRG